MKPIEHQYLKLLKDILDNGTHKQTRNGETISVFGRQIRHSMSEGFPLFTTKKMAFKTMVTELLWFLKGDTNIKYLVDNGCNIWNGDAYKNYIKETDKLDLWKKENCNLIEVSGTISNAKPRQFTKEEFINKIKTDDEFAKKWGELGPIYGKQWRKWANGGEVFDSVHYYDQIKNLINELKTNPDSRRLMVNAWNVGELDQMVLPPCHYGFQVYTRKLSLAERRDWCKTHNVVLEHLEAGLENEEDDMRGCGVPTRAISLMWNQRSVDTFLGLPFNIASYGLLLEILAKEVNMVPDELIGNLGDVHLYKNHIEQAKEQIGREPMKLPKLNELPNYLCMKDDWECYKPSDFTLDNYQSHPTIKAPLSN